MAIWPTRMCLIHQEFARALFWQREIECELVFCWLPHLDMWKFLLKTKFRYLSITENHDLPFNFYELYESFLEVILNIREKLEREYNNYFNELWC
jgi:hypothetical protein